MVGGDTRVLPYGFGPYASRIAANAGPAVARAAREVRLKATKVAASMLEAAAQDIRITAARAHVVGVPDLSVRLADVAKVAVRSRGPAPGPGLKHRAYLHTDALTLGVGAHCSPGGEGSGNLVMPRQ